MGPKLACLPRRIIFNTLPVFKAGRRPWSEKWPCELRVGRGEEKCHLTNQANSSVSPLPSFLPGPACTGYAHNDTADRVPPAKRRSGACAAGKRGDAPCLWHAARSIYRTVSKGRRVWYVCTDWVRSDPGDRGLGVVAKVASPQSTHAQATEQQHTRSE